MLPSVGDLPSPLMAIFELVEDFGIHSPEISCNAEVKADISSAVSNFSDVSRS